MDEKEFSLKEYQMSGYLLNHKMTCDTAENSTTLCLKMAAPEGAVVDLNYKILLYFPNGDEDEDLTNDGGASITAQLMGKGWQLTYVEHHPVYKTRVWTLQPEKTYCMAAGESLSVNFTGIQVNHVPGMSRLCLIERGKDDELQVDIQKYAKPQEVSIKIVPEEFVYGDEISVCFTVTSPEQYKSITYCGKPLDKTKSSFEEKEVAVCDVEYTVEITNEADYKVQSSHTVCLHGLVSCDIEKITPQGVELDLELTKENVDKCRLHEETSGKDWEMAVNNGKQKVEMEIAQDKTFYPIISLKGTARQDQGEKTEFHMPVIKSFGPAEKDVLEDVEGFLSVEQVKECKISYASNCKVCPGSDYTLYYELINVKECWIKTSEGRFDVDVNQTSVTIRSTLGGGTVHAVGEYDCEITKDISWKEEGK